MAVLYDFLCMQLALHSGECRQSNRANIVEGSCKIQKTQPTKSVRGLCVCRQVAVEDNMRTVWVASANRQRYYFGAHRIINSVSNLARLSPSMLSYRYAQKWRARYGLTRWKRKKQRDVQ